MDFSKITDWLLSQGWAGICVIGMSIALFYLKGLNSALSLQLLTAYKRIDELQEKRVTDAMQLVGTAKDVATALDKFSEILKFSRPSSNT